MWNARFFRMLVLGCLCCCTRLIAARAASLPPGLAAMAPDVLVVMGRNAPPVERGAAEEVAAALRTAGGPVDNLIDDEAALKDLDRTAFSHLVLVGTYSSNELLHQQWGHFALDRTAFAHERAVPLDSPRPKFYDGAPAAGFYVFGVGTFSDSKTGWGRFR